MITSVVVLTLLYSFLSASFRGIISVIDRYQFGIRRQSVTFTNLYNNILALIFATLVCTLFGDIKQIIHFAGDPKVIIFSLILQVAAHAFSYAFRYMKVPSIIIFSKMADLFIPPIIFIIFSTWELSDFIFSASTFLVCLPVLFSQRKNGHLHFGSAAMVCLILIIQGSLSPWFMMNVSKDPTLWIPFTVMLIFWRLVFSAGVAVFSLKEFSISLITSVESKKNLVLMMLRSSLTFGAQAFLVLSLSLGKPVIAWPILNATGLISVVFSSFFLKEHPGKYEILAVCLIVLLGIIKISL